jgi:hypothetical protein
MLNKSKHHDIVRQKNLEVTRLDYLILKDSYFIPDCDHISVEGAAITARHL